MESTLFSFSGKQITLQLSFATGSVHEERKWFVQKNYQNFSSAFSLTMQATSKNMYHIFTKGQYITLEWGGRAINKST